MAYVESPKQDATAGELAGIKHAACAAEVTAKEVVAQAEAEVACKQGEISEGRRKEAGAEQDAKQNSGTPEGEVVAEGVSQMAPSLGIASSLYGGLKKSGNPSAGKDVAHIAGETFEDAFKAMKSPIKTGFGRSIAEKAKGVTGSMKSLTKDTKGVQDSGAAAAQVQVAAIKGMVFKHGFANEKVLGQVIAAERAAPAPGMGGPGMGAPGLAHNGVASPRGPTHLGDEVV